MEKHLSLQGLSIARTGEFVNREVIDALARLDEFGARHVKISRRMDVLVVGDRGYSKQPEKAHAKGIPILTERQFASLLRQGFYIYDAQEAASELLHVRQGPRVFGEVRSILNQPRPSRSWGHLCTLLDQCERDEQEMLVDYIARHMARWSLEERLVCSAPLSWLEQLAKQERAPKFRLVRTLDLTVFQGEMKRCVQILACQDLHDVLALRVAGRLPGYFDHDDSAELHGVLDRATWCDGLVSVGLGGVALVAFERLLKKGRLAQLERLELIDVRFGWASQAIDLYGSFITLCAQVCHLKWIGLGKIVVEFLGWALSGEGMLDDEGELLDSRDYLGDAWEPLREAIMRVDGLDVSACRRWNAYMARFLEEFELARVGVSWPGCVARESSCEDLFDNPMTYMRQSVNATTLILSGSGRTEQVWVEVEQDSGELAQITDARGRALVEKLCVPDSVGRVVLRGLVEERVLTWFEEVLGEDRVEVE